MSDPDPRRLTPGDLDPRDLAVLQEALTHLRLGVLAWPTRTLEADDLRLLTLLATHLGKHVLAAQLAAVLERNLPYE